MTNSCLVENCTEPAKKRKMCKLHYQRWYRTGSVESTDTRFRGTTLDRFWYYVKKLDNGCWEWTGPKTENGRGYGKTLEYGLIWVSEISEFKRAHRWAYEKFVGPILFGLQGDHLCDFSLCVNPEHIDAKTNAENSARSSAADVNRTRQLSKTHCNNCGRELVQMFNQRGCRYCAALRARLAYKRKQPNFKRTID